MTASRVETKAEAEALIPGFEVARILNQDQSGRRITCLGSINGQQGVLVLERAAFPSTSEAIVKLLTSLSSTTNLGANDVYRWYMSNQSSEVPNVKVNLIWPCTDSHVRKYTAQQLRYVTETSQVYLQYIKPYIASTQRTAKRLDWIYNILDGHTEQDDVVYRSDNFDRGDEGFLLLPDLNWDRRTISGIHLLALVQRRDIWSIRDLKKRHVPWLRYMRAEITDTAAKVGTKLEAGETVESDQFKCYLHYHPTYYHFHIHVVHVMLEAEGGTQSVGKAVSLDSLISQLENMAGDADQGLESVDLSFFLGEESELWKKYFAKLKEGQPVTLET